MPPRRLILLVCLNSATTTISIGAFPALLPELGAAATLADRQLGAVAGAFGLTCMLANVPVGLEIDGRADFLRPTSCSGPSDQRPRCHRRVRQRAGHTPLPHAPRRHRPGRGKFHQPPRRRHRDGAALRALHGQRRLLAERHVSSGARWSRLRRPGPHPEHRPHRAERRAPRAREGRRRLGSVLDVRGAPRQEPTRGGLRQAAFPRLRGVARTRTSRWTIRRRARGRRWSAWCATPSSRRSCQASNGRLSRLRR